MKEKDGNDKEDTDFGHSVEHDTDALDKVVPSVGYSQMNKHDMKYAQLTKNSNHAVTFKENSLSVQIPGPTGHDLTRGGNVGVYQVLQWSDEVEIIGENIHNTSTGRSVLDFDKMYANRLVFIASLKCTLREGVYKLVDTSDPTPISFDYRLHNFGKSSFGVVLDILDKTGRELGQVVKQSVLIDQYSRKTVPIPDWWKKKHGSHARESRKLVTPELSVPTENTYKYGIRVSWNDIDSNNHVNYKSYVMFCLDAAMDAVKHGFYVGFFDDILKYNVKTLQVRYVNEALAGDNLTVVTWQDAQNPRVIHFSIEREGNALVQCSMEFFLRCNL